MNGSDIVQEAISRGDWNTVTRISSRIATKGTRYIDSNGYVYIIQPSGNYFAEHRVVMANKLGRPLGKHEIVHHINGDKTDNRPENLELWVQKHLRGMRASDLVCPHCGKPYA